MTSHSTVARHDETSGTGWIRLRGDSIGTSQVGLGMRGFCHAGLFSCWASSWYGAKPDPQLSPAARLLAGGNEFYGTAPEGDLLTEAMFFKEPSTDATLAQLSRALDDLRRLGATDLHLNHTGQLNP